MQGRRTGSKAWGGGLFHSHPAVWRELEALCCPGHLYRPNVCIVEKEGGEAHMCHSSWATEIVTIMLHCCSIFNH